MEKNITLPQLREKTRRQLCNYHGSIADLVRITGLNRNWFVRFKGGEFNNVGVETLQKVIDALDTEVA